MKNNNFDNKKLENSFKCVLRANVRGAQATNRLRWKVERRPHHSNENEGGPNATGAHTTATFQKKSLCGSRAVAFPLFFGRGGSLHPSRFFTFRIGKAINHAGG